MATVETTAEERVASPLVSRPELLAPAGDRTCLTAAIENGADAVYFGLQTHNARARASNFHLDELPEVMGQLHARGVRGYVTLNTLVFSRELEGVETLLRRVSEAGVDALIVQDLGMCRLAKAVAPELELHASTQMSVTSAEGVELARELGCSRVILARELSLQGDRQDRGAGDVASGGVRSWGVVRGVLGPVPDERGAGGAVGESGRVCPGVPDAV